MWIEHSVLEPLTLELNFCSVIKMNINWIKNAVTVLLLCIESLVDLFQLDVDISYGLFPHVVFGFDWRDSDKHDFLFNCMEAAIQNEALYYIIIILASV